MKGPTVSETHTQCDDSRLVILLHGDEQSAEFQQSAEHVESCDICCQRLTELAADGDTWTEISQSLQAESLPELSNAGDEDANIEARRLEFLRPPSHPEMLGRLGRYEVERIVGAGGMGIVLKGHDSELNRPVAIKVLAPHLAHSGAARQRFAREGRAAAAIVHEHVVAIHNVESDAEVPFLVMQLVPGRSLQARVDADGPLGVKEILRVGVQAAAGLSAAHSQGVVHRDVKPSNILLENDVERVLLTDFGLARVADDATMTRSGIVAGTPHYMSPEQANGSAVDQRSDLFSLGAVLYFMATGHPPFRAERTMAVLNRICNDRQRPVWKVNPEIPVGTLGCDRHAARKETPPAICDRRGCAVQPRGIDAALRATRALPFSIRLPALVAPARPEGPVRIRCGGRPCRDRRFQRSL